MDTDDSSVPPSRDDERDRRIAWAYWTAWTAIGAAMIVGGAALTALRLDRLGLVGALDPAQGPAMTMLAGVMVAGMGLIGQRGHRRRRPVHADA